MLRRPADSSPLGVAEGEGGAPARSSGGAARATGFPPVVLARGPRPSYTPTGYASLDALLALADRLTRGRASAVVQVMSYLIIGTISAIVSLGTFALVYLVLPLPVPSVVHYLIAYAVSTEFAQIVGFLGNDRYTFRHLPGQARAWWVRLLRYHMTCLLGILVTLAISSTLYYGLAVESVLAQAVAIVVVLFLNFTLHHIWTYRRLRSASRHA